MWPSHQSAWSLAGFCLEFVWTVNVNLCFQGQEKKFFVWKTHFLGYFWTKATGLEHDIFLSVLGNHRGHKCKAWNRDVLSAMSRVIWNKPAVHLADLLVWSLVLTDAWYHIYLEHSFSLKSDFLWSWYHEIPQFTGFPCSGMLTLLVNGYLFLTLPLHMCFWKKPYFF